MKYPDHRVIKTALGTAVAIYIADLLKINFGVTAGIITIITIQGTKKESFKIAIERFLSSAIGFLIAVILFYYVGFSPAVFGIFVLICMPICLHFNLIQGFMTTVVLVTHMLVVRDASASSVLNEVYILGIGTVVALILNMYMPGEKESIGQVKKDIDTGMKKIISYFGEILVTGSIFVDEEKQFRILKGNISNFVDLAFRDYNNDLINASRYEIDLAAMKKSQYKVLIRMRRHFQRFFISSDHAHMVADFTKHVAESVGVDDVHNIALRELSAVREKFVNMPLPHSRVEFESRAMFFQFLNDIEEFLEIKRDFLEKYTITGEKIE